MNLTDNNKIIKHREIASVLEACAVQRHF